MARNYSKVEGRRTGRDWDLCILELPWACERPGNADILFLSLPCCQWSVFLMVSLISFQYYFEGRFDLVRFVKTVKEAGLLVHLRIGPYACAEWNYGLVLCNSLFFCDIGWYLKVFFSISYILQVPTTNNCYKISKANDVRFPFPVSGDFHFGCILFQEFSFARQIIYTRYTMILKGQGVNFICIYLPLLIDLKFS